MYFITTLRFVDGKIEDQRPIGYFKDFKEAALRVENNSFDIFECGYYKYAVIVKINEGLYPTPEEEHWFEYCKITDNVVPTKPKYKDFRPYILG